MTWAFFLWAMWSLSPDDPAGFFATGFLAANGFFLKLNKPD